MALQIDLEVFLTENRLSEYIPHLEKEGYEVQDLLESDDATLLELVGGKKAHLGRLKNGLAKLRECAAGTAPAGTATALLELSGELPMVLAGPAFEFAGGHESSAVLRLWALCDLVELGVRLAVITGLAEHHGKPPEKLRGILSEKIERPTLGQWLHMARAVVEHLPQDAAFPALTSFVSRLDKEICGHGDLSASAVVLRNRLAHGGGLGKKAACDILSVWESRMETLAEIFSPWRNLQLVCLAADGSARLLRGTAPGPWEGQTLQRGSGMVRGVVGGRELDLWPLMTDSRDGEEAVSGIYSRRGEVRLEYTPIEGDFAVLEAEVDQGFLELFRRPGNRIPSPFRHQDFSEELRKEASRRIGREEELERLAQAAASLPPGGILWVGGVAGMGKSCLVASAASALLEEQKDQSLVLAYRFKAGGGRCSVEDFLAFACERIEAWEGLDKTLFQNAKEPTSAQARFLELVRSVKDGSDLLVVADGLDELPPQSDNWLDTVILASAKGRESGARIRWILAGRPERGIDTKLLAGGAREVFPGGLPPMRPGDVRSFFLERLSRSKVRSRLLERDEEKGLTASNPFLDEVVRRSEGLPVYMNHVAGDLIAGRITPDQERQLPKGLAAYHEELLRRCAVGDLQAVMTPLVATLALAHEPLGAPLLTSILRSAGRIDSDNVPLVERALAGVSSMIRRTPLHDGTDGFTLYHTSLREHIRSTDSFRETLPAMRKKLSAFCSEAMRERRKNPPRYVRRQAVKHFLEAEDWDNAVAALSDIEFIEARARAQELPSMLGDYAQAATLLPEGEKERHTEAARQAELDRYAREMSDYAATWTRIREGSAEAEPPLPRPVESVRLWSEEEIAAEIKRMTETPNRLDTVKAFRVFVATNSAPLQKYAAQEGFAANLARNDTPSGPVHEEGKRRLKPLKCIKLIKSFALSETYNPLPACTAVLEGHSKQINSISISANGRLALSGSGDKTLRVWNLESGDCIKVLAGHTGVVLSTDLSPDGRLALSGSEDFSARCWDLETGKCLKVLEGHTGWIRSIAFSADARFAISGSRDGTLRIWDLESEKCLKVLSADSESILSIAISLDGSLAISKSEENTLRVWNLVSGECIYVFAFNKPTPAHMNISCAGTLPFWNRFEKSHFASFLGTASLSNFHQGRIYKQSVSADGCRVISANGDYCPRVWSHESGECLKVLEGHTGWTYSIAIRRDGHCAVSGSYDKTLRVWNLESGKCPQRSEGHTDRVKSIAFSANGCQVVSSSLDDTLCVWDCDSGKLLKTLSIHTDQVNGVSVGRLGALALSSDGRRAVSGGSDKTLRIWNLESGKCVKTISGHRVFSLAISGKGRVAVSGGFKNLRVWDLESGECSNVMHGHTNVITSITLRANDRQIVSGSKDKTLRVWDLDSGECLKVLKGHAAGILSVALSADGRLAVSLGSDKTMIVWDMRSGSRLRVFNKYNACFNSISLSQDGRNAILSSEDKFLHVCNIESGECYASFFAPGITCTAINREEGKVGLGYSNGRVEFGIFQNL